MKTNLRLALAVFVLVGWTRSTLSQTFTLRLGDTLAVIRVSDDELSGAFGSVTSVGLLSNHEVIVIDERMRRVSVHSATGPLRGFLGRHGSGPGEHRMPTSVWEVENGRDVMVHDVALRRVSRLDVTGSESRPVSSFRHDGLMSESCGWSSGRTILRGDWQGGILHIVSADGIVERSFGKGFNSPSDVTRSGVNEGPMLCLPRQGRIVLASKVLGTIQMYDQQGRLLWEKPVEPFRQVSIRTTSNGGIVHEYPPEGFYHRVISLVSVSDSLLVVQVGEDRASHNSAQYASIRTVLLRIADGRVVGVQINVPHLRAVRGDRAVATVETIDGWVMHVRSLELAPRRSATR